MKVYGLKVLLLHGAIALTYFSLTDYLFVVAKDPEPIGTAIRQWLCMFLHLTITLYVLLTLLARASDKKKAALKLFLHVAIIGLIISISFIISTPVWEWLWSLR